MICLHLRRVVFPRYGFDSPNGSDSRPWGWVTRGRVHESHPDRLTKAVGKEVLCLRWRAAYPCELQIHQLSKRQPFWSSECPRGRVRWTFSLSVLFAHLNVRMHVRKDGMSSRDRRTSQPGKVWSLPEQKHFASRYQLKQSKWLPWTLRPVRAPPSRPLSIAARADRGRQSYLGWAPRLFQVLRQLQTKLRHLRFWLAIRDNRSTWNLFLRDQCSS